MKQMKKIDVPEDVVEALLMASRENNIPFYARNDMEEYWASESHHTAAYMWIINSTHAEYQEAIFQAIEVLRKHPQLKFKVGDRIQATIDIVNGMLFHPDMEAKDFGEKSSRQIAIEKGQMGTIIEIDESEASDEFGLVYRTDFGNDTEWWMIEKWIEKYQFQAGTRVVLNRDVTEQMLFAWDNDHEVRYTKGTTAVLEDTFEVPHANEKSFNCRVTIDGEDHSWNMRQEWFDPALDDSGFVDTLYFSPRMVMLKNREVFAEIAIGDLHGSAAKWTVSYKRLREIQALIDQTLFDMVESGGRYTRG
jgi:hypothetical protein